MYGLTIYGIQFRDLNYQKKDGQKSYPTTKQKLIHLPCDKFVFMTRN